MTTEKLYDRDSHLFSFRARVLACEARKGGFFPESGSKTAHFVHKVPKTTQNKAFQEKKYLTEGPEWLY